MGKVNWVIAVVIAVLISSFCQVVLKKSASQEVGLLKSVFNVKVILTYAVFFLCMIINIAAVSHGIELSDLPFIESLSYIFVPIISVFFLKERMNTRKIVAIMIVSAGVVISQIR